jgi:K+-sensing histidine kinase KdpD
LDSKLKNKTTVISLKGASDNMLGNYEYISLNFDELELKQRNKDLAILLEMSNSLSTSVSLEEVLKSALSKVLAHFGLKAGRIYLLDDEGEYLHLAVHQGMEPKGLERVHINEGFSGRAVRVKSFIAQHVFELKDKKRAALLSGKGFKGIICVPLMVRGKVVGVLNLATSKILKLDQDRIDLLTAMGNQIAVAANNAKLYEDLENKLQSLKQKKEMIKFFAYSVSHDLKSPATGIYGLAKRLRDRSEGSLDEKGMEYCDQILKASKQMVSLVEDINSYIVTKEASLNIEKINMKEIMREIRDEFCGILEERKIVWSEPEAMPEIWADRMALSRIFRNLLDNALKYGGKDLLEIKIGYEGNRRYHIFSLSDDGVGIEAGEEEKIFELFQRNETSKGTDGSGLGLAIIKEIAQRHGGQVWLDRQREKGAAFYVSISKNLGTAA